MVSWDFQITVCTREGLNRLNMSAYDARPFCLGVRIIRRLSLEQVCARFFLEQAVFFGYLSQHMI